MGSATGWVVISAMFEVEEDDAEQEDKEHHGEGDDSVAGDAFFVAQGAQALDATGGEIVHEARIGGGGAGEMVAHTVPEGGQVVFAHAEFIEDFGGVVAAAMREGVVF